MHERTIRLLLVEDNPADARLVREYLRDAAGSRFFVDVADRLSAAVELLGRRRFDVILVDLSLPDSQGIETFERLRGHAEGVPLIVFTGLEDAAVAFRAVQHGAQDYLYKRGLDPDALARSIRYALEREELTRRLEQNVRELQESEQRYRVVTETAQDAILTVGEDGRVQFANLAVQAVFGVKPAELVGRHFTELLPERLQAAYRKTMDEYLATGVRPASWGALEAVAVHREGHEVPLELSIGQVQEGGHRVFTIVARDISERVRAQAALKRSEERFRKLVERSADVITVVDSEAIVRYASPSMEAVLGFSPAEVVGRKGLEFIHPDDAARAAEALDELLQRPGSSAYLQQRMRHKDGSWRWMDGTVTNLLAEPSVGGVVSNFRDITDRVEAQQVVEASEMRYRLVARASGEAIWDWDLVDDTVQWTEGLRTLFGHREEEMNAALMSFYEFIHHEDRDRVAESIHAVLRGGGSTWAGEYRLARANGTFALVAARGYVVHDESGKPVRFIGTLADVSEREAVQRFREGMIDLVSHEFRTPITVIQGYAELLAGGVWEPTPEARAEARSRIERASRHLSFLLTSIVELSRLRGGARAATMRPLRAADLFGETLSAFEARRPGPARAVETRVGEGAEELFGDQRMLLMALVELLDNASKFSAPGTPIKLEATRVGDEAEIAVLDEGEGIAPEVRRMLFRPFVQADLPPGRRSRGAGIGLALVQGLVQAQGGRVEIAPRDGKGTAVRILVPLRPPSPPA